MDGVIAIDDDDDDDDDDDNRGLVADVVLGVIWRPPDRCGFEAEDCDGADSDAV